MGILPVGFFSPLPLAMMIPFMATQSLAMGEAFGKSFQYGKRKISSMTNEEFNKLTMHDLMLEQTANIKSLIPELNKQMAMSQDMQKAIFQEMINLIPTFFESFKKAIPSDLTETSQASPSPAIQQIRYTTDRDFELQQDKINAAIELFNENFLKQSGTKEELAEKLHAETEEHKAHIKADLPVQYTTPAEKQIASAKVLAAAADAEYLTWITKLGTLKSEFQMWNRSYARAKGALQNERNSQVLSSWIRKKSIAWSNLFRLTGKIKQMSNDYRHSNNHIRENALRLRGELQSGVWTRKV